MLLTDPSAAGLSALPSGDPLPPITPIPDRRQPCEAVSERLVVVDGFPYVDAYQQLGILPRRTMTLRESVLSRLHRARSYLDPGFDLTILDATRTLEEQRSLLRHYGQMGSTDQFVASVSPDAMRPPHTTGGAVDLTLAWWGTPLALGTDYDAFVPEAGLHAFEDGDGPIVRLRRMLASCLFKAGFVSYEPEWWHWSYGDDVWAYAHGRRALFDIVELPSRGSERS